MMSQCFARTARGGRQRRPGASQLSIDVIGLQPLP